jgi:hypothetical protein
MTNSPRLVVLTDSGGNVVAGHHHTTEQTGEYRVGLGPLASQSLHEVDLPGELHGVESHEVLRALVTYRVQAGALVRKEA